MSEAENVEIRGPQEKGATEPSETAIIPPVPPEVAAAASAPDAPSEQGCAPEPESPSKADPYPGEDPEPEAEPGSLELIKLEQVDADEAFRLRPEGCVDSLATSMARLGQLSPIDVRRTAPDRFQVIAGFRRVAALRLLKREKVLARVHGDLADEDALRTALADLLEHKGASNDELLALRQRLEGEQRLTGSVREAIDSVLSPAGEVLGPETVEGAEEEVDLDELAQDIARRMAALNQDLALVVELWSAMDPALRRTLLDQLAYPEQLAAYLRGL